MQRSSRAPLLSATLTTVSCWIISTRLLDDLGDAPPLLLGQRSRLDDAHAIADATSGLCVVHLVPPRVPYHLFVQGMRLRIPHEDDHRLLHLVADHDALAHLAPGPNLRGPHRLTHHPPPSRAQAPPLVSMELKPAGGPRGRAPARALRAPGRAPERRKDPPASPSLLRARRRHAAAGSAPSWCARSRAGCRGSAGDFPPVRSPVGSASRRASGAAGGDARRAPRRSCRAAPWWPRSACSYGGLHLSTRVLAHHEARLDGQLVRREAHRLTRSLLRDARHLEQDAAGEHDRHPAFRLTLATAHSCLRRLLGERVVGKHADPDLAATLDVARHRASSRLDLTVGHPAGFDRLEPIRAEVERAATVRSAGTATTMELAVLGPLGHQHRLLLGLVGFGGGAWRRRRLARGLLGGARCRRRLLRGDRLAPRGRPLRRELLDLPHRLGVRPDDRHGPTPGATSLSRRDVRSPGSWPL